MDNLTDIIFEIIPGSGGDIGKIILNRPKNLNALNLPMCEAIRQHLTQWAQAKAIKAVIIAGAGDKAFCAGGDVRAIYDLRVKAGGYGEASHFFQQEYAMNLAIFHFPKPYIAFLDGITMGGGVGVSIHGSHAIATERLVWAMPETRIGFFPDVGVCYHLAKLPGHIGAFLALTGERLQAADLYQFGLVKAVIASERLKDLETALITTPFSSDDFNAVTRIITEFHQSTDENLTALQSNINKITPHFAHYPLEEIMDGLTAVDDEWCQTTAKILRAQSPLSLKITLEHLRHCADFNFEQVMAENSCLASHFLRGHDFMEGVRAAVIDKDHRPQWRPSTLTEVNPKMVRKYFDVSPNA